MEHDSTAAAYDLIYLVSCSANNMAPDLQRCQTMNCPALFQMARRHLLTVTAAFALEQAVPLPSYFIEEKYKAIRRLSLYDAERDGIFAALDKHAIWHMPLKGIVLQKDYPQPEMREMSDNDILIDASKADKIKEIMEAAGYTCRQFQKSNHDIYRKGKLLEFEMHRALFDDSCQQPIAAFGKALQSRMVQDDENAFGCHLREDDFYLYLICKIYCDYQGAGTGLRALLDVYLYNRSGKNRLNRKYIAGELQKLQLDAFEQNVRLLAEKLFSLQPLSEEEQMEVRYFIESDCHGTPENLLAKTLGNDDSLKAKRRYALSRIFPSQESVRAHHPVVSRHKALYPLLVVYRPFKGFVKHRRQIKSEIKRLKSFKKKEVNGKYNDYTNGAAKQIKK